MLEFQPKEFGDYVLQDRIGAGGMAEIFLATSKGIEGFEKRLVIKRILPSLSDDDQFVRMFIEEAKLCVALRHPNIVQVYDLGVIDYQYYIAMEYVDGRDLLKTLAACGKNKIGFPTDIALHIIMESLKGLEYAHNLERPDGEPLRIIHRDVSPSNLLLSFEGEIKIGDFGIAKASTREKTATGILKGKFGYMAPEQVTGAAIDHRADVFAMGIVLYELLTGHRLFAGKNDLLVLEQVRDAVIDPPPRHYRPDLDAELEGIVLRALARRPEERFQSAGDLHDAIHNYVYRSRALVGPAHLGRFMQSLFLSQPEEIARRSRARLPPVPCMDDLSTGFGDESTQQEQDSAAHIAASDEGMDAIPPVELSSLSSLSEVYVSEEYEWGSSEDDSAATRNEIYPVAPQPLVREHQEVTIQTDVGLEISDSDVEAIAVGSQISTRAPDPKAEVMALRRARAQDDPTAFDLQDEPGYAVVDANDVQALDTPEPTRDDMAPADRNMSIATVVRDGISDLDDETRDGSIEPAEIVERTRVSAEPEPAEDDQDVEPTVQFDSTVYPALRAETPKPEANPPGAKIDLVDGVSETNFLEQYQEEDPKSEFGTLQIDGGDIPTAEVSDMEFDSLTVGPEEGTEVAFAPIPSADATHPLPAVQAPFEFEDVHEEEDETLLRDDANGELAALIARNSPLVHAMEVIEDEADRTDLFDPVEEGMVAELAAQTAGAPSRRRPLTGRRARPVLLPAEGEAARIDPRPTSQVYGRRRSSLRRRVATRIPLSVVNPGGSPDNSQRQHIPVQTRSIPEDRAVSTRPTPVVDARANSMMRANTGAGSLVDVEAYSDAGKDQQDPADQPAPREASGITAALSEAALIDDEIAELRKPSVVPRGATDAGVLAEIEPDEDPTQHGADLRSAIINRRARRRMVTQSVVLYGDEAERPREDSISFGEESERSVPEISDAGQLNDEGASELFGVLSVLDEDPADFDFDSDNELSLETDARFYADFSDSVSYVHTETPPERKSSEQAMAEAYGSTSFGHLADGPDDTGQGAMLGFGDSDEEATASVTDGQVLSVSQLNLQISPDILTPDSSSMQAFDLEFNEDSPLLERGLTGAVDPSSRGDSLISDDRPEQFVEFEEPTQEESMDAPTGLGSFRPNSLEPDLTSDERPSNPGMRSDSYDFGSAQQERWRNAYDEPPATAAPTPDLPVRPVTMQGPSDAVEATASQMATPEELDLKGRSNQNVLRAVVERQRVAKELNRGSITPRGAGPSSQPNSQSSAPGPSSGSAASSSSKGVVATAGVVPPQRQPSTRKKSNKLVYVLVFLAVAISVAAGVSTWLFHEPEATNSTQSGLREGLVEVPEAPILNKKKDAPPAEEAGSGTDAGASPTKLVDLPAKNIKAPATPKPDTPETTQAPKKVAPKTVTAPAKKRRKRPRRARRKAPKRAAPVDRSKSVLRMTCEEPIDIRISTVGTRRKQTRFKESLKPGWYRVKLSRNGDKLDQVDVNLMPGQSVTLPCP